MQKSCNLAFWNKMNNTNVRNKILTLVIHVGYEGSDVAEKFAGFVKIFWNESFMWVNYEGTFIL